MSCKRVSKLTDLELSAKVAHSDKSKEYQDATVASTGSEDVLTKTAKDID